VFEEYCCLECDAVQFAEKASAPIFKVEELYSSTLMIKAGT
jgi:hypothetical protein